MLKSCQVPSVQRCMHFMFLLYFFIFACFYNQFYWYDNIFPSTVGLKIIFNCYKMTFSSLQKLLEKCMLLFYQKSFQILIFYEVGNDTWYVSPIPKIRAVDEFWTVIISGGWSFWGFRWVAKGGGGLVFFCT